MTTTNMRRAVGLPLLLGLAVTSGPTLADETARASERTKPQKERAVPVPKAASALPVYVPPRRGRPRSRIGGGVRSTGRPLPKLAALAPDHVALTTRSQPVLYWHIDTLPPERATLLFTLVSEEEIDPLIAEVLERPTQAGLQRIDLTRFDYELEPQQEYVWTVALVSDFERRSRDLVTFGWIERTAPKQADGGAEVGRLAASGLWYDALDAATGDERDALLDQLGLPSGAAR